MRHLDRPQIGRVKSEKIGPPLVPKKIEEEIKSEEPKKAAEEVIAIAAPLVAPPKVKEEKAVEKVT